MKAKMLYLFILFMLTVVVGCSSAPHVGRIYVRNSEGQITKWYEVELDRPMLLKMENEDTIIEVDSRTKGIIESLTMTLGLSKSSGGSGYYDEYY